MLRLALVCSLLFALEAAAYDYRYVRYQPGHNRVIRVNSGYLGRGLSTYSRRRAAGYSRIHDRRRDQSWRLNRVRRPWAHQDPFSYGRCYWRGYYRPTLYCRQYKPRYGFYKSVRRYPQPTGLRGPSYPGAYARPPRGYGYGYGPGFHYGAAHFDAHGYGSLYQSRYGYRHPHTYLYGGSGPYGFADPWGYRLLPAFDFAPILTRLTTVFTIDGEEFDGPEETNADGLPQPRTGPVGARFLAEE